MLLLLVSLGLVLAVIIGSILSKTANNANPGLTPNLKKKIKHLVRTGCSMAVMAKQDSNPLISVIHCYTAKAYMDAAQHFSGGNLASITRSFGIDVQKDVIGRLESLTKRAMKKLHAQCPKLSTKGSEHFSIGADWVA